MSAQRVEVGEPQLHRRCSSAGAVQLCQSNGCGTAVLDSRRRACVRLVRSEHDDRLAAMRISLFLGLQAAVVPGRARYTWAEYLHQAAVGAWRISPAGRRRTSVLEPEARPARG